MYSLTGVKTMITETVRMMMRAKEPMMVKTLSGLSLRDTFSSNVLSFRITKRYLFLSFLYNFFFPPSSMMIR